MRSRIPDFDYLTVLTQADYTFLNGRFKKVVVMPNPLTWEPEKMCIRDRVCSACHL